MGTILFFCTVFSFVLGGLLSVRFLKKRWIGFKPDEVEADLCDQCGYDCRGLSRCPECGTPLDAFSPDPELNRLREAWPTQSIDERIPDVSETPTIILQTLKRSPAGLLCQHLSAHGIRAKLVDDRVISGAVIRNARSVILTVWSADAEFAREIAFRLWPERWRNELR